MAQGLLPNLFERNWRDPSKIHGPSAELTILIQGAKESLAKHLKISANEIEVIADLSLGFHLAISGLLPKGRKLIHSSVDRKDIFAIARTHQINGGKVDVLNCDLYGEVDYSHAILSGNDLIVWQSCNRETGVTQPPIGSISKISDSNALIFADMTGARLDAQLPANWGTALWDATSWGGPKGIAFLAIKNGVNWVNPLPHIDVERVSNGFSVPLFLASVVALENSATDFASESAKISKMNSRVRKFVTENIQDSDIAGRIEACDPRRLSISFLYVQAEELLRALERAGFLVDSGSACSAADLAPSHVLAAMGVLTHGNIRMTFRPEISDEIIEEFLTVLKSEVESARLS